MAERLKKKVYERELARMQEELVLLQEAVRADGLRIAVVFEGRDTAGKGGTIKRITDKLNPRVCHVVALGTPTDRERGQWYFQRYLERLPTAGEMALFDRSWYNRAGVERVMGFCTEEEVEEFFREAPEIERMLVRSDLILIKYWLEVSAEEQLARLMERVEDPTKQWKLSPIDAEAPARYDDYSRAVAEMFARTSVPDSPWYLVDANDQRRARLNLMAHLLELLPQRRTPDVVRIKKPRRKPQPLVPPENVIRVPERW
jgi:polyphosphate kinase